LDHDKQNSSKRQPGLKKGDPDMVIEIQAKIFYVDGGAFIPSRNPMLEDHLREIKYRWGFLR
jgi:hypothetical protein